MANIKTTKDQIVEWGQKNIGEVGYGCDAADMSTHCWRCGYKDQGTERCHVIPHALGGEDTPSNFRLLCHQCHKEAPNVNDYNEMDNWIRRTCVPAYNTFWQIREIANEVIDKTTRHWGINKLNESTQDWAAKTLVEEVSKRLNIPPGMLISWVGNPLKK